MTGPNRLTSTFPSDDGPDTAAAAPAVRSVSIARYAPAALLVSVALAQMAMVKARDLTPWKGGGFGMFSTADTPFARFLRVRLLVDGHEVAVPIPPSLRDVAQAARVLPTQGRLDELARRLGRGRWIRDDSALLDSDSREQISRRLSGISVDQVDNVVDQIEKICHQQVSRARSGSLVRMLDARETPPALATVLVPPEVRVELWRYRFDGQSRKLLALKVREARGWP